MKQATIYKITNDINSKVYVGQTYKTPEERFQRHSNESRWKNVKRMPIVLAILKYGKEHFRVDALEVLPYDMPQSYVDSKEVEWGIRLNSLSPNGYNLKLGNAQGIISDETKRKISVAHKGKKVSPKTIQKLRDSHKGHKVKESTKKKLSDHFKGKPTHINTKIGASLASAKHYTLISPSGDTVHIYNMRKFAKEMKMSPSKLCELSKGKIKRYKGWTTIHLLAPDEFSSKASPSDSL